MARALTTLPHSHHVSFESFGVRIGVSANDERIVERLPYLAPQQSRACELAEVDHHVDVTTRDGLRFNAKYDIHPEPSGEQDSDEDIWVAGDADLELVLALLEAHVHECIGLNAPEHLFIRGGAVLHRGAAIAFPGEALSGRSTLVSALMRAGATAYSDEYAVFDGEGRLHPYTKRSRPAAGLAAGNGSENGTQLIEPEPRPAATIAITAYTPGAEWQPQALSRGESMLALLAHAVPADERPEHAMRGIARILDRDPIVVRGERGEAEAVAPLVLAHAAEARSGAA